MSYAGIGRSYTRVQSMKSLIGIKLEEPLDFRPDYMKKFGDDVDAMTAGLSAISYDTYGNATLVQHVCLYCKTTKRVQGDCVNCGAP